jgi:hypothetical protein
VKKYFKVLGIATALAVILTIVMAGVAFAAGPNNGDCVCDGSNCEPKLWDGPGPHGQTVSLSDTGTQNQNQGTVCLSGECPNYDGVCDSSNCEPKLWGERGPHGAQAGK